MSASLASQNMICPCVRTITPSMAQGGCLLLPQKLELIARVDDGEGSDSPAGRLAGVRNSCATMRTKRVWYACRVARQGAGKPEPQVR